MHRSAALGRVSRGWRAAGALAAVGALAAGLGTWAAARADPGRAPAPCAFEVAQKLGLPFYRVCGAEPGAPSFWISAPIGCSPGDNTQVQCPHATALVHAQGAKQPARIAAQRVAMLDGMTAHRLCGMRFAGRFPTRAERLAARHAVGLVTLIATQASEQSTALSLSELPEWVSEGACDNPSKPGSDCRLASYPTAPLALPLAWNQLRTCEAVPVAASEEQPSCLLGAECQGRGQSAARGAKRAVTGVLASPGKDEGAYALSCEKAVTVQPVSSKEPLAAVRCVLDDSARGRAAASALGR